MFELASPTGKSFRFVRRARAQMSTDPGGTNIGASSDPFGHQFWLAHRCYCFIVFLLTVIVRLLLALVLARRLARFGPELARVLSVGSAVRDGPVTWLVGSECCPVTPLSNRRDIKAKSK